MKEKISVVCSAVICCMLFLGSQSGIAQDANPLKDPGFELQSSPKQGGWSLFDQSRYSSKHARSGSWSMFNRGFSRILPSPPFVSGTASGSYQAFAASPGSRWRLTGYGMTPNPVKGAPAFGILQLSFFDDQGKDLGTVETSGGKTKAKTSNQVNSQTRAGEWILLDTGIATAPASTTKIHAFTLYVDYSGKGVAQGVYFDDLKLCALDSGDSGESACQ